MKDFSKIYHLKGLKPKNKGHMNFYECCYLTKKVYLMYMYNAQHHLQFQIEECSSAGHISYYYAASALGIEVKFSSLHFCHKVRMLVRHLPRTFYCKVIILAGTNWQFAGTKNGKFCKDIKKKIYFLKSSLTWME